MTLLAVIWWHGFQISAWGWVIIAWACAGCGLGLSLLRDDP